MDERKRIEAKLAELRGAPADIAAKLRENGITGVPNVPERCVIAQWIDAPVWKGEDSLGEPQGYYIDFSEETDGDIVLPSHLQEFITLFDSGEFSDLIN